MEAVHLSLLNCVSGSVEVGRDGLKGRSGIANSENLASLGGTDGAVIQTEMAHRWIVSSVIFFILHVFFFSGVKI